MLEEPRLGSVLEGLMETMEFTKEGGGRGLRHISTIAKHYKGEEISEVF
jgi:hypothetical protein